MQRFSIAAEKGYEVTGRATPFRPGHKQTSQCQCSDTDRTSPAAEEFAHDSPPTRFYHTGADRAGYITGVLLPVAMAWDCVDEAVRILRNVGCFIETEDDDQQSAIEPRMTPVINSLV